MILVLDNYDSFVHNLARYFRQLGCPTNVVRSDSIDPSGCRSLLDGQDLSPDAIVISPGPNRPEQAGCSVDVIRQLSHEVPILGICLGHQAIGTAFGANIIQCGPKHGMDTPICHDATGIFRHCALPMTVGRYHSLAIDPQSIPPEIDVTATTDDGVIMGIQHRSLPLFGLQFHPESVLTPEGMQTLENFVSLAADFHRSTSRRLTDQQPKVTL